MAVQVSPGVVTRLDDLSDYAQETSSAILAVVGVASRGPFEPTIVTSEQSLTDTYGIPMVAQAGRGHPRANTFDDTKEVVHVSQGMVSAGLSYLTHGNQLICCRVKPTASPATPTRVIVEVGGSPLFEVVASSPGSWANDLSFVLREASSGDTREFRLEIYRNDAVVEVFSNLTFDADLIHLIPSKDAVATINAGSNYIRVEPHGSGSVSFPPRLNIVDDPMHVIKEGTNAPTGSDVVWVWESGSNGTAQASDYTDAIAKLKKETLEFNMLAVPGANFDVEDPERVIIRYAIKIAESRNDFMVLVDPDPQADTVQKALYFINGGLVNGAEGTGNPINSWHAAYYWAWAEVFDAYNGVNAWAPPSGLVAGAYAYNDAVADPWWAPAGINRGRLQIVNKLQYDPNEIGDREQLQAPGQCVNPLVIFPVDGCAVYGQKTTQRKASSLDRVDVGRMMLWAQKIVATSLRVLVFEPNDDRTQRRFKNLVEPLFKQVQDRRGVYAFQIRCDSSTNPPEVVDQNILKGRILIKPTKTAEVIDVTFTLASTGASFGEL
jgi:hypothetical protein